MKMKIVVPGFVALFFICACSHNTEKEPEDMNIAKKEWEEERNLVDTIVLRRKTFNSQLVSNGKLKAYKKASLRFSQTGIISELHVKNGASVKKGQVIASIDKADAESNLATAKNNMERAELDLYDFILGQGYSSVSKEDYSEVPEATMRIARMRSGYNTAELSLKEAERRLAACDLIAPIDGKVANLETKLFEYPKGTDFCTVIDDRRFEVTFPVLESEIGQVREGQEVKVATFIEPDLRYEGVISEINPTIDAMKGQIQVKALLTNPGGLIDGMNVKVYVENQVPNMLVVPKTAVLIRDNLEVLFRYGEGGRAMWTYVNVVMANSDSYVVRANADRGAELNEGDAIIVKGNLTLANESKVEIAK